MRSSTTTISHLTIPNFCSENICLIKKAWTAFPLGLEALWGSLRMTPSPPAGAGRGTASQNRATCGGHRAALLTSGVGGRPAQQHHALALADRHRAPGSRLKVLEIWGEKEKTGFHTESQMPGGWPGFRGEGLPKPSLRRLQAGWGWGEGR